MNIEKLNETLKRALAEDVDILIDTMEEILLDTLGEYILDDKYEIGEIAKSIAQDLGYKIYDGACVLNVKQRPIKNLDLNSAMEKVSDDELDGVIQAEIGATLHELQTSLGDDFSTFGRSEGYWGMANAYKHVKLINSAEVAKNLCEKIEQIEPEEYAQIKESEDCSEFVDLIYSTGVIDEFLEKIADNYEYDVFTFDDTLLNAMNTIENTIQEHEQQLQTIIDKLGE